MSKTAIFRARIEPALKARAEEILQSLGLSATDAITLFYHQVIIHQGLPFDVRRPVANAESSTGEPRPPSRRSGGAVVAEPI